MTEPTADPSAVSAGGDSHPVPSDERAGYLGFVAHEMRNPLSTALWSAELLGRLSAEDRGGARGEKLTGMCLRTLARLRVLLEDFFLIERLGIHGLPLKRETVALPAIVEQVCGRIGGDISIPPLPDLTVVGDASLLERMVESVVALAARDSAVKIDLSVRDGMVHLSVAGAPPAPDALVTPSKGTLSDSTGRALGVLVARSVAEAHGGSLRVESGAYIVSLPLGQRGGQEP